MQQAPDNVRAAVWDGDLKALKKLVKNGKGANDFEDAEDGTTLVWLACQNGQADIVKYLMKNGADVNIPAQDGYSALFVAAQLGYAKVVEALVKGDANIELAPLSNATPLFISVQEGHLDVVKILKKGNANQDSLTDQGITPDTFVISKLQELGEGNPDAATFLEMYKLFHPGEKFSYREMDVPADAPDDMYAAPGGDPNTDPYAAYDAPMQDGQAPPGFAAPVPPEENAYAVHQEADTPKPEDTYVPPGMGPPLEDGPPPPSEPPPTRSPEPAFSMMSPPTNEMPPMEAPPPATMPLTDTAPMPPFATPHYEDEAPPAMPPPAQMPPPQQYEEHPPQQYEERPPQQYEPPPQPYGDARQPGMRAPSAESMPPQDTRYAKGASGFATEDFQPAPVRSEFPSSDQRDPAFLRATGLGFAPPVNMEGSVTEAYMRDFVGAPSDRDRFGSESGLGHMDTSAVQQNERSMWKELRSGEGERFFYNTRTGEMSVNRPAGYQSEAAATALPDEARQGLRTTKPTMSPYVEGESEYEFSDVESEAFVDEAYEFDDLEPIEGELEKQSVRNPDKMQRRYFTLALQEGLLKFWKPSRSGAPKVFFVQLEDVMNVRAGFDDYTYLDKRLECDFQIAYDRNRTMCLRAPSQEIARQWIRVVDAAKGQGWRRYRPTQRAPRGNVEDVDQTKALRAQVVNLEARLALRTAALSQGPGTARDPDSSSRDTSRASHVNDSRPDYFSKLEQFQMDIDAIKARKAYRNEVYRAQILEAQASAHNLLATADSALGSPRRSAYSGALPAPSSSPLMMTSAEQQQLMMLSPMQQANSFASLGTLDSPRVAGQQLALPITDSRGMEPSPVTATRSMTPSSFAGEHNMGNGVMALEHNVDVALMEHQQSALRLAKAQAKMAQEISTNAKREEEAAIAAGNEAARAEELARLEQERRIAEQRDAAAEAVRWQSIMVNAQSVADVQSSAAQTLGSEMLAQVPPSSRANESGLQLTALQRMNSRASTVHTQSVDTRMQLHQMRESSLLPEPTVAAALGTYGDYGDSLAPSPPPRAADVAARSRREAAASLLADDDEPVISVSSGVQLFTGAHVAGNRAREEVAAASRLKAAAALLDDEEPVVSVEGGIRLRVGANRTASRVRPNDRALVSAAPALNAFS